MATEPDTASTARTSSRSGLSAAVGIVIASMTRTTPELVSNVVSSTFVPGR
jgi:hypothetical protein